MPMMAIGFEAVRAVAVRSMSTRTVIDQAGSAAALFSAVPPRRLSAALAMHSISSTSITTLAVGIEEVDVGANHARVGDRNQLELHPHLRRQDCRAGARRGRSAPAGTTRRGGSAPRAAPSAPRHRPAPDRTSTGRAPRTRRTAIRSASTGARCDDAPALRQTVDRLDHLEAGAVEQPSRRRPYATLSCLARARAGLRANSPCTCCSSRTHGAVVDAAQRPPPSRSGSSP